jgi:CDP-diacylglycerol--serine O-phosphatidyltransferase
MPKNRRLRRGIYLLPTLFTVGNLLCGFSSLVWASMGFLGWAALLIIFAGILDMLDGRIARLTKTTSDFGREFDSLADVVSFGIAPAFLAYHWALTPLQRVGWLIAFLYVVCAAMRLARFNIQSQVADKRYFAGLPVPGAAAAVATTAYAFPEPASQPWVSGLLGVLVVIAASLMISRLRYRSFKDVDLRHRRSYVWVFPLAGVIVAILTYPAWTLFGLATVYLLSGPVGYFWGLASRRWSKRGMVVESGEILDESSIR